MEESNKSTSLNDDSIQAISECFGEFELNAKKILEMATDDSNNDQSIIISPTSFVVAKGKLETTRVTDQGSMALSMGARVEAKDFEDVWFSASIREVDYDEMEVLLHYDDLKRHDEWISVSSPRLRPLSDPKPIPSTSQDIDLNMPRTTTRHKFEVGEKCLARWNNNGRFTATIQKKLGDERYEVIFDDGVTWTCSRSRLIKLRPETPETPNSLNSVPNSTKDPYHTHLFDPSKDFLGSKSERREKKRKINIKALFNIGQKKRIEYKRLPRKRNIVKETTETPPVNPAPMEIDDDSEPEIVAESMPSPEPEGTLENFEQVNEEEHEQIICKMKEVISKLECSLSQNNSEIESNASPTPIEDKHPKEEQVVIKEEIIEEQENEQEVEQISEPIQKVKTEPELEPIKLVINIPSQDDLRRKKLNRMRKAKKLRFIREQKVKIEMEKVRRELEEMRKQVQAMKQQVDKKKELSGPIVPGSGPVLNESFLLPGEWCCRWVDGQPEGVVFDTEKCDGIKATSRHAIRVEDRRIPSDWVKLLVRRSVGTSAGKWDVMFISPDNRKIHTKGEMKIYLQTNPNFNAWEHALTDFGIHRKLSRRLGWDNELPPTVNRTHKKKKLKRQKAKKQKLRAIPVSIETVTMPVVGEGSMSPALGNPPLEEGYVYVGSLKAQIINNMLRCPADGCFKNFRTNILLQMHIKYYHKELTALMGATPHVIDLAYARAEEPEIEPKTAKPKHHKTKKIDPETAELLQKEMNLLKNVIEGDSPKLRKALVKFGKRKRPRVLLPVRDPELAKTNEPIEDECSFREEFEKKFGSSAELMSELDDFESAISSHTVCKITDKRHVEKKTKVQQAVSTASEDDDLCSDLDTLSSFPQSGSPDGTLGLNQDLSKEGELYYTCETGERIKIVHMKREEIINCHCGFREEDGLMIQCELCLCWQHALCHNIQKEAEVPEKYTCSICLNPRRGRRSRRFVHDQDRLYEGLLPGAAPCPRLRRTHELAGNLLRVEDALHALTVKRYVATKKYHPKLYLWAGDWGNLDKSDKYTDLVDLNSMITDIKHNIPLPEIRIPSEDLDDRLHRSDSGSLANLLGSPTFDLPITTSDLETLAKSVQEVQSPVLIPQPETAIQDSTCRRRLLVHVQRCQAIIDARLDSIEAQVAELESQEPSLVDDESADYIPRTKQTIHMLLRDLDTMEDLGLVT